MDEDNKFTSRTRVTVTVPKRLPSSRRTSGVSGGLRHGPFARPDYDEGGSVSPNIVILDPSHRFRDFADYTGIRLGVPQPDAVGVMAYMMLGYESEGAPTVSNSLRLSVVDDSSIATLAIRYLGTLFNKDSVRLPPFSGVEYRKIDRAFPVPSLKENLSVLNLKLVLSSAHYPITQAKRAPAATLPDQVHESSYPTGQDLCRDQLVPQYWYTNAERDQRSLWRDFGVLGPPAKPGMHLVGLFSAVHFEPFDTADTDNYKVTMRLDDDSAATTFDSPEVVPPKVKVGPGAPRVKIYAIPQLWHYVISYRERWQDGWYLHDGGVNPFGYTFYNRDVQDEGWIPAFCSPFCLSGWETPSNPFGHLHNSTDHPAKIHAYGDTAFDPTDLDHNTSELRFMQQLALWRAQGPRQPSPIAPGPPGLGPDGLPPFPFGGAYDWYPANTGVMARDSGVAIVTQEGAPAKMLVAGLEFGDDNLQRFKVWRKTPRVVGPPVVIYSGPYNDPGYSNKLVAPSYSGFASTSHSVSNRITSGVWPGVGSPTTPATIIGDYLDSHWAWSPGSLCTGDQGGAAAESQWPVLMMPRYSGPY